jgi:putative membrane protein
MYALFGHSSATNKSKRNFNLWKKQSTKTLRERLALQRTILANQTTVLAFFSYCNVFFVAGLSTRNLLKIENSIVIEVSFYLIAFVILILGIVNFFKQRKMITENENTLEIIN